MAAKKIVVSFSPSEAAHVREAVRLADQTHKESLDRSNPALTRALKKIDDALSATESAEDVTEDTPE
jgi:hypothetical protein